jgi:uncharacterized protein YegL
MSKIMISIDLNCLNLGIEEFNNYLIHNPSIPEFLNLWVIVFEFHSSPLGQDFPNLTPAFGRDRLVFQNSRIGQSPSFGNGWINCALPGHWQ